jgi:hypothetical protein
MPITANSSSLYSLKPAQCEYTNMFKLQILIVTKTNYMTCRVYMFPTLFVQNLNILGIRTLLRTSTIALNTAMSFQSSREISTYGKWQCTANKQNLWTTNHIRHRPATIRASKMAEPRDVTDRVPTRHAESY